MDFIVTIQFFIFYLDLHFLFDLLKKCSLSTLSTVQGWNVDRFRHDKYYVSRYDMVGVFTIH